MQELAQNIGAKMYLTVTIREKDEPWAIDGVIADPSVWTAGRGGQTDDEAANTPGTQSGQQGNLSNSGSLQNVAAAAGKSHEFEFDTRQTVTSCMQKVAQHFQIQDPDSLWY